VNVKIQALGFLFVICKYMPESFDYINIAAKNNAIKYGKTPFSNIIDSLSVNDLELKVNALTFINWMLFKCPTEKKMKKFLARLENLGLFEECQKLVKINHHKIQVQLRNL
jgi:hypothetical protein